MGTITSYPKAMVEEKQERMLTTPVLPSHIHAGLPLLQPRVTASENQLIQLFFLNCISLYISLQLTLGTGASNVVSSTSL